MGGCCELIDQRDGLNSPLCVKRKSDLFWCTSANTASSFPLHSLHTQYCLISRDDELLIGLMHARKAEEEEEEEEEKEVSTKCAR